jgi:hypothetical protein
MKQLEAFAGGLSVKAGFAPEALVLKSGFSSRNKAGIHV